MPKNKAKEAARKKAYYQSHKAELDAKRNARHKANRNAAIAWQKAYYQLHKAERNAYDKAYYENHRSESAEKDARRRARVNAAFVEYVSRDLVYKRDGGRCHVCGRKVRKNRWHMDHIIPLARGGEHSYRNVAVACPKCNLSKGTKAGSQLRLL